MISETPEHQGRAFEIKFLLEESTAIAAERWARSNLSQDPHGEAELGGAYRATSLYFDTPALDTYNRTPGYRRRKFRARRYGPGDWVSLECKERRGGVVVKRRSGISLAELPLLTAAEAPSEWDGEWFRKELSARRLRPVCQTSYMRRAFIGACSEGPLRLTLDHDIRGRDAASADFAAVGRGTPLLPGMMVLELKFIEALPLPFKSLVTALRIHPSAISKYRRCLEALGATPHDEAMRA